MTVGPWALWLELGNLGMGKWGSSAVLSSADSAPRETWRFNFKQKMRKKASQGLLCL